MLKSGKGDKKRVSREVMKSNMDTQDINLQKENAITEGVIWKQILLFFFPILFGTFSSSCTMRRMP